MRPSYVFQETKEKLSVRAFDGFYSRHITSRNNKKQQQQKQASQRKQKGKRISIKREHEDSFRLVSPMLQNKHIKTKEKQFFQEI